MLADVNRKISIIAYYLSKFDMDAVRALGYENYSRAFEGISSRFGKNNNYLKLRRDEFDVLTGSSRKGSIPVECPQYHALPGFRKAARSRNSALIYRQISSECLRCSFPYPGPFHSGYRK